MTNNFKSVSHIIWMNVISLLGFLLARFSPLNRNWIWIVDILLGSLMSLWTSPVTGCHSVMLWTATIYCMHVTVPFLPYCILHFGKPLQPLLSGQLAHSRGWPLNICFDCKSLLIPLRIKERTINYIKKRSVLEQPTDKIVFMHIDNDINTE